MKNDKELLEELLSEQAEYEEIKSRLNKYLERLDNDFQFYKNIYVEHINDNKSTVKQQFNYENAKKQLENANYYFAKYKKVNESSDNVDTETDVNDLLPENLSEE